MTDLFSAAPTIQPIDRSVGQGNGRFLGHLANGMPRAEMRRRFKAGEYEHLHPQIAALAAREG